MLFGIWSVVAPSPASAEFGPNGTDTWQVADLQPSNGIARNTLVNGFAEARGVMYVGGKFGTVRRNTGSAGTAQPYLAAFNANTGAWISSFRPVLDGPVYAMRVTPDGSKLIVGGEFTGGLVAYDLNTGAVDPSWSTRVTFDNRTAGVINMDLVGNDLYIAGNFNRAVRNGTTVTRNRLAKLNANTGAVDGQWRAGAFGGSVRAIDISPDRTRAYIGGLFVNINGQPDTQYLATVNTTTGELIAGLDHGTPSGKVLNAADDIYVFDIESNNHTVYIAAFHNQMWMLDANDMSMRELYFSYGGGGDHHVNEFIDGRLYSGGHFRTFIQRYDGFAQDLTTAEVLALGREDNPANFMIALDPSSPANTRINSFQTDLGATGIWAIAEASDGALWLGGDITRAGNQATGGFVRLVDENVPTGPVTPAACSVTLVNGNQARVTWTRAANDNASRFVVRRSRNGGQSFWAGRVDAPATAFTNTNLANGSTYTYTVETQTAGGQNSTARSCSGSATPGNGSVAVAPSACSASLVNGNQARVTWTRAANDNASRFVVRRSRNGGQSFWAGRVDAPATTFTNTNLANGSTYTYTVETLSAGGDRSAVRACSGSVLAGNGGPTAVAPASCSVTLINGNQARITWTRAASDAATAFVVRRSRNGGQSFWAGRVDAPATTFTNTNLAAGATFTYTVETLAGTARSAPRTCTGSAQP